MNLKRIVQGSVLKCSINGVFYLFSALKLYTGAESANSWSPANPRRL